MPDHHRTGFSFEKRRVMKICTSCQQLKNISCFHSNETSKDKLSYICKECAILRSKIWYQNNKNRASVSWKERYENNKNLIKQKVREWCLKNPEKRFKIHRKWYEENKEEKKIKDRLRRKLKKDHINKLAKLYAQERRKNPQHRLSCNISRGIAHSLYSKKNGRHWEILVGYNIIQLIHHLEKQFQLGMTWENYGKWHIDHKIPIAVFNFEKPEDLDFKRCWELKNLQPLWAEENLQKKAKLSKPFQPSLLIQL